MAEAKSEIDATVFTGKSSIVSVEIMGNKKIKSINIDANSMDKEEIEMLEDMMLIAINEAMDKIDNVTEEKLGKFSKGMPGLF